MTGSTLVGRLAEIVGFKLGLAVTEDDLVAAVTAADLNDLWPEEADAQYRYRSEVFESLVRAVLHHFGDPYAAESAVPPVIGTIRSLPEDHRDLAQDVIGFVVEALGHHRDAGKPLDIGPILESVDATFGSSGGRIARLFLQRMTATITSSPWSRVRRFEFPDLIELHDLFESESVTATLGQFFDQRFVDYLDRNGDSISDVNWRRFEGSSASTCTG